MLIHLKRTETWRPPNRMYNTNEWWEGLDVNARILSSCNIIICSSNIQCSIIGCDMIVYLESIMISVYEIPQKTLFCVLISVELRIFSGKS
jgi:hypothetical protein